MAKGWGTYQAYRQVDVETASQGKLLVMLFNGAIQRAEVAKRALGDGAVGTAHASLLRAQDIIAELRAALDLSAAEVATDIDRVYEYLAHLLIQANMQKSVEPIDEFLAHATALRDTWDEAFASVERNLPPAPAGAVPETGATPRMNVTG